MVARRRGVTYPLAFNSASRPPTGGFCATATSTSGALPQKTKTAPDRPASRTTAPTSSARRFPKLLRVRCTSSMCSEARSRFGAFEGVAIRSFIPRGGNPNRYDTRQTSLTPGITQWMNLAQSRAHLILAWIWLTRKFAAAGGQLEVHGVPGTIAAGGLEAP